MSKQSEYAALGPWAMVFAGIATPSTYVADGIVSAFSELRRKVARGYHAWRAHRRVLRTVAELSRLEDHVLQDIGVHRSEIYALAVSLEEDPKNGFRGGARDCA